MAPQATAAELEHGVPLFLEQLAATLRREQETSARAGSPQMKESAALHGAELRRAGFTLSQVVHDYGDVCQAVTALALELEAPISTDEFRTLNRCLDDAIAQAVTAYTRQREASLSLEHTEQLAFFAHELRNALSNAILAFEVLRGGAVGITGSTGALLGRNLMRLRELVDRSLTEVRLATGTHRRERVSLADFMEEVELSASIEATSWNRRFSMAPVAPGVMIDVDRQLLAAALANLVLNAFKFSRADGQVVIRTDTTTQKDRVLFEVEDECGGLPPGRTEGLFLAFEQRGADRGGLGVGLAIARDGVEANGGVIHVRDLPGRGCIFIVDLPRAPAESVHEDREELTARD
jgi:signal transduction histidine kinase